MQIRILGTAAAEGWPAVFCACETCFRARKAGGKNLRSRASILIDDVCKIDLPPDTYYHVMRFGLQLHRLKYLFFTHSHDDHFAPSEIGYLRPPFAHGLENTPITIYGNPTVLGALESQHHFDELPVKLARAEPFIPIKADHLTFTPVLAAHKPGEEALNYVIQDASSTVLYASDTGLYGEQTMGFLSGLKLDLMIVECTQGKLDMPSRLHMGFDGVLELRDRLARSGAVGSDTRTVITHFSHNIGLLHEELEEVAGPEGIVVAYDGMEI